jgi:hypothetical protein
MKIPNLIVAEYSVSQNCFHVHSLKDMLQDNIQNMIVRGDSDWLVIGVFEEEVKAHDYIAQVREQMKTQDKNWVEGVIKKSTGEL